jgi:hypothetical protein
MCHLKPVLPAVLLLAAAATQAAPQSPPPAPRAVTVPAPSETTRTGDRGPVAASPVAGQPPEDIRTLEALRQTLWKNVISQYPPSVGRDLQLNHFLLTDNAFLEEHEALAAFLREHPEVRLYPNYFLPSLRHVQSGESDGPPAVASVIPLAFFALMGAVAWFLYQRSRAALQARQETTAKLIDGLLAREDLIAHLDTPAGRRIIDSLKQRPEPAPASRILRAVQAGIVLTFLGLGFAALGVFLVDGENRIGFATTATVLATIGAGLLASAGASYLLSRRLGLIQTPDTHE